MDCTILMIFRSADKAASVFPDEIVGPIPQQPPPRYYKTELIV